LHNLYVRTMIQRERELRLKVWADRFENRGWNRFYRKQLSIGDILCYICENAINDWEEFFYKHAKQSKACHIQCALDKHLITEAQYKRANKKPV
jgi:hypothetical protein